MMYPKPATRWPKSANRQAVAYNLVLMLDISGSMRVNDGGGEVRQVDADGNATITTRLALAKAGLVALVDEFFSQTPNISVKLGLFASTAQIQNGGVAYTDKASLIAAINGITGDEITSATNYIAALQTVQTAFGTPDPRRRAEGQLFRFRRRAQRRSIGPDHHLEQLCHHQQHQVLRRRHRHRHRQHQLPEQHAQCGCRQERRGGCRDPGHRRQQAGRGAGRHGSAGLHRQRGQCRRRQQRDLRRGRRIHQLHRTDDRQRRDRGRHGDHAGAFLLQPEPGPDHRIAGLGHLGRIPREWQLAEHRWQQGFHGWNPDVRLQYRPIHLLYQPHRDRRRQLRYRLPGHRWRWRYRNGHADYCRGRWQADRSRRCGHPDAGQQLVRG
ncbi:MAG: VWA domain-containing protein [Sulfuritalea sp.]|nr:VWA domain-containing protein [Sulfuritalea sp.]